MRRGLTLLAVPQNALASARALYSTVDAMWRAAGQRDTDFSFYTKRATLAAVYSATLLAWIADTSGDLANIEGFLDRRLQEVAKIPKASAPMRGIMASDSVSPKVCSKLSPAALETELFVVSFVMKLVGPEPSTVRAVS